MKDTPCKLLDTLQSAGPSKVVLHINEDILEPASVVWHILATSVPTQKTSIFYLLREQNFYYTPYPKYKPRSISSDKEEAKNLDLFGRKVFTSTS